jgi:hypothetical protein
LIFLPLGDLVFGVVEVVDEALAGGFVCVFEGDYVSALTLFFGVEGVELLVDGVEGGLGVGYVAAGVEDGLESGFERGVVAGFVEEELELLVVGVGEAVGGVAVALAADVEANGLAGVELGAEAIDGGRGFFGFGLGVEGPASDDGHFGDDGAMVSGGVVEDKGDLVDVSAMDVEDAAGAAEKRDAVGCFVAFGGDVDGLVGGVGEEAFFVRVDGVEEAFAAEVAVFDEGEAAPVEGKAGGIGDPQSA